MSGPPLLGKSLKLVGKRVCGTPLLVLPAECIAFSLEDASEPPDGSCLLPIVAMVNMLSLVLLVLVATVLRLTQAAQRMSSARGFSAEYGFNISIARLGSYKLRATKTDQPRSSSKGEVSLDIAVGLFGMH